MKSPETAELLRQYVREDSQEAFTALVERYTPVVYGAAMRHTGRRDIAADVAQRVFTDLARRAKAMTWDERLGAWLHRRAVFAASDVLKSEIRRRVRETEASRHMHDSSDPSAAHAVPVAMLDKALQSLSAADRHALTLRYLEERDFNAVGTALGISGDAAQKRVTRALEKLRVLFVRRGVVLTAATLTSCLTSEANAQVPAGLTNAIASTALKARAGGWWFKVWPAARAALAGAAGVLAIAAVPLWKQQERIAARQSPAVAETNRFSSVASTARPPWPKPVKMPMVEEGLTLEEIVKRLAILMRQPATPLVMERGNALQEMLDEGDALRILPLLAAEFPDGIPESDWFEFDTLYAAAAGIDEQATLAWAKRHLKDEAQLAAICRILSNGGPKSLEDIQDWLPLILKPNKNDCSPLESNASDLLAAVTESLPLDEAAKKLVALAAAHDSRVPLDALKARLAGGEDKGQAADWQCAWRALQQLTSPQRRHNARRGILRKLAEISFNDARAFVESMPAEERAAYASLVVFPRAKGNPGIPDVFPSDIVHDIPPPGISPAEPPDADWTPHVEWLAKMAPESVPGAMGAWHQHSPEQMTAWLEKHPASVTPALSRGLLVNLAVEALPSDEAAREEAVQQITSRVRPLVQLWKRADPKALEEFLNSSFFYPNRDIIRQCAQP